MTLLKHTAECLGQYKYSLFSIYYYGNNGETRQVTFRDNSQDDIFFVILKLGNKVKKYEPEYICCKIYLYKHSW